MNIILKLFSVFIVIASSLSAMEDLPMQGSHKRTHDESEQRDTKKQKIEPQAIALICKDDQNNYHSIKTTKQIIGLSVTLSELYQEAQGESSNNPIKELDCASLHRHVHELVSIINLLTDMYHQYENKSYTYKQFQKAMKQPTNEDIVRWFNDFKQQVWLSLKSEHDSEEFKKLITQLDIPLISALLDCCIYEQKTGLPYILGFNVGAKIMEELIAIDPSLQEIKEQYISSSNQVINQLLLAKTPKEDSRLEIVYSPDFSKAAQIIYEYDISHPILRLVDTQTNSVRDLSLDQFENSSENPYVVWDQNSKIFSVRQKDNSYIIFTDEKNPIYLGGTKYIQFSPQNNFAILIDSKEKNLKILYLKSQKYQFNNPFSDFISLIGINLSENENIGIYVSPDERYAVIRLINKGKIIVYDLYKKTTILQHSNIMDYKFSSASDYLYIVSKNALIYSLLIFNLKEQRIRNFHTSNNITQNQISPDGNYIIISPYEIYGLAKGMIIALDRDYQQATDVLRWLPGHDHAIAVTLRDTKDSWGILDVEKNSLITPLFTKVTKINFLQSKKYLVIMYEKGEIKVWDLKNNCPLLNLFYENIFTKDMKLAWSTDDRFLIHNSDSGKKPGKPYTSLLLFDCENKKYLLNLKADIIDFGFAKNSHIFFTKNDTFSRTIYNVGHLKDLTEEILNYIAGGISTDRI